MTEGQKEKKFMKVYQEGPVQCEIDYDAKPIDRASDAIDYLLKTFKDDRIINALRNLGIKDIAADSESINQGIERMLKIIYSMDPTAFKQAIDKKGLISKIDIAPDLFTEGDNFVLLNHSEFVFYSILARSTFRNDDDKMIYMIKGNGRVDIGTKIQNSSINRPNIQVNDKMISVSVKNGDQVIFVPNSYLKIVIKTPVRVSTHGYQFGR